MRTWLPAAPEMNRVPSLQTREYLPGEERLFLGLLTESLRGGGREFTADFWRWKHLENPFGISWGRYAWDAGSARAAALRVLMRWRFRAPSGEVVTAARAVDTATHVDYRRTGLFGKLTETAVAALSAEGCGLIFNTPNEKSLPGYLKLGWRIVARWPIYARVVQPLGCAKALLGLAGRPGLMGETCFGPGVLRWRGFEGAFGEQIGDVAAAWERSRWRQGLRTPRDGAYLRWRYGNHPSAEYGFLPIEDERGLAAFAVLRANRRFGLREVAIAEIFLRDGGNQGRRLMRKILEEVRSDYCVASFASGSLEGGLLRRALFAKVPGRGVTFTVKVLNPAAVDPRSPASWDLTLGDLEVF
jgi:hypothetical protein